MSSINKMYFNIYELRQLRNIAFFLDIRLENHNLTKIKDNDSNAYQINNNLIYLHPLNDGLPTCNFEFYKDDELIIDNKFEYNQITNLDEILIDMVRIYDKSLDYDIVLDPYCFMLELTDNIKSNYHGNANLVITEKAIKNPKLNKENFDDANKYYINHFLDQFMCWNFGLSINRNEILKKELEDLNNKVINMGIRENISSGLDIYGVVNRIYEGFEYYKLPVKNEDEKKLVL